MSIRNIEWATYGVTTINPLAISITLLCCVCVLFLPRKSCGFPLALVLTVIPNSERIVIFTLDFNMLRIFLLFALLRFFWPSVENRIDVKKLDYLVIAWALIGALIYVLGSGVSGALVYKAGHCFELLGVYFLTRCLITSLSDAQILVRHFGVVTIVIAIGVAFELSTRYNPFSLLGGVPETTWIRDGRLRCQAAFSHPIMLGTYGATLLPLFIGLFLFDPVKRALPALASVASIVVVVGSASSGPLFALLGAIGGFLVWPMRNNMSVFRWTIAGTLLVLHFIRDKPVWHLIGRASDLVGGTGYHRYQLIDAFINRFSEWALLGSQNVAYWGWGLQDITNQYVLEGVRGGASALLCFILILITAFKSVGRSLKKSISTQQKLWHWSLGSCIGAHTLAFIGVSYFGQLNGILMTHLAIVGSLVAHQSKEESIIPNSKSPAFMKSKFNVLT